MKELYLAGGPFYGLQEVFSRIKGVRGARTGYARGAAGPDHTGEPSGENGDVECVKVSYDPKKIDITALLSVFFAVINPYTDGIQGKCRGPQYRSRIYYSQAEDLPQIAYYVTFVQSRGGERPVSDSCMIVNDVERKEARRPPVQTRVARLESFSEAPEEEQDYLRKHPDAYTPIDISMLEKLGVLEPLDVLEP